MPAMKQVLWAAVLTQLLGLSRSMAAPPACPIQLADVTGQTRITFVHTDGSSGRRYIIETVSAGLALFDYDQDGDIDIYFLNGAPLEGTQLSYVPRKALYRNDGNWTFTDVTDEAGVGDTGYGLGVTVGDYDDDGHPDLYLNNYGPNVFYRNNGDGTFADVTSTTGTSSSREAGAGICFLDSDRDGDLDLFVANYLDFSYDAVGPSTWRGYPVYPNPGRFRPVPNILYRNNGDGTYTDISRESGIMPHQGRGMGVVCADYDDDGDTDVFVGNDGLRNFLFQNDGTGKFTELGMLAGFAFDRNGNVQGSMGVACGDYDGDGRLDMYVTTYQRQLSTLFRNLGKGIFEDVSRLTGAGSGSFHHVKWGTDFVDFDHDGDRDIFVACGHLMDNVDEFDDSTSYHATNVLLMNTGRGKYNDVSQQAGEGMKVKLSSRGAGFDDLDGDGDVDVVVLNSRREPTVLRNDSRTGNHWLQLRLRGNRSNRDGVGARVRVVAGNLAQIAEVHSGRGYQSHYGTRLHFGLGPRTEVDQVEVRWIGGTVDIYKSIQSDRLVTLIEGSGQ